MKKLVLMLLVSLSVLYATQATNENVTKLYVATFDRAPDSAGLNYWVNDSGLNLEQIAQSFFDQSETQELYPPTFTNDLFINATYQNLFNRDSDNAGFEYWKSELDNGTISKDKFILALVNGALGDDAILLSNKTTVAQAFVDANLNNLEDAKTVLADVDTTQISVQNALDLIKSMLDKLDQAFITTWNISGKNSKNPFEIQILSTGDGYNYSIDWGDGKIDTEVTDKITHRYSKAGIYIVKITGDFPKFYLQYWSQQDNSNEKLLSIEQWGKIKWKSFLQSFSNCPNMVLNAKDVPNLSNVTELTNMFQGATSFTGDLSRWDVSTITNMSNMFSGAESFTSDLSKWDVSNVSNMSGMFHRAKLFNSDLNKWNVSNVKNMSLMFMEAKLFNSNISSWKTSSLTSINSIFNKAESFNQPIGNWDVSKVTTFERIFFEATSFNQDISNWNVSNISQIRNMFENSAFSIQNYNNLLIGWSKLNLNKGIIFSSGYREYSNAGKSARQSIIDNFNWTFYDSFVEVDETLPVLNPLTATIAEDSSIGSTVGQVIVKTIGDSSITSYTLSGTGASSFTISNSGEITVAQVLNYETKSKYDLTVYATTTDGNSLNATVTINISNIVKILVLNDIFITISENTSTNSPIAQLSGKEMGDQSSAVFIISGEGAEKFTLSHYRIYLKEALDYKTKSRYDLFIHASTDLGDGEKSKFTVNVTQAKAVLPVLNPLTATISEDSQVGSTVGQVTVQSQGDSSITSYTLSGTGASSFIILNSGEIEVTQALDYKTKSKYDLTVYAVTLEGNSPNVAVTINIKDVIEKMPVLNNFTATIAEDISVGSTVGQVTVQSQGDSSITSYTLSGTGASSFAISNSGKITVKSALDYSTKPKYDLTVYATTADGNSNNATVTINISDVLTKLPVLNPLTATIAEDISVGSTVGQVTVQSQGDSSITSYTLSGTGASSFIISNSGEITVTQALDYETKSKYDLTVYATIADGNSPNVAVTINIIEVTSVSKVKKTGQTQSYADFDDGYYQIGIENSYSRSNEIVTDNVTKLMWQDDEEAKTIKKTWVTQANYDAGNYSNTSGDTATTYCKNLTLGGYDDWQLPTIKELQTIVNDGTYNPSINSTFVNITSSPYWSSATNSSNTSYAWNVNFYNGNTYYNNKGNSIYVRCVGGGQ